MTATMIRSDESYVSCGSLRRYVRDAAVVSITGDDGSSAEGEYSSGRYPLSSLTPIEMGRKPLVDGEFFCGISPDGTNREQVMSS